MSLQNSYSLPFISSFFSYYEHLWQIKKTKWYHRLWSPYALKEAHTDLCAWWGPGGGVRWADEGPDGHLKHMIPRTLRCFSGSCQTVFHKTVPQVSQREESMSKFSDTLANLLHLLCIPRRKRYGTFIHWAIEPLFNNLHRLNSTSTEKYFMNSNVKTWKNKDCLHHIFPLRVWKLACFPRFRSIHLKTTPYLSYFCGLKL